MASMITQRMTISESTLTYARTCRLAASVDRSRLMVVLDVAHVEDIESFALARLVALKGLLRRRGGDLCLTGLSQRAKARVELYRLGGLLDGDKAFSGN